MSFLCDVAVNVVTGILKYCWAPVERQIGYLVQYESNLQNLKEQAETLEARRHDLMKNVRAAQDMGQEIKDEVKIWQEKITQVEEDVKTLEAEVNKIQGRCHAFRLDWVSRHRLSRQAKKKTSAIDELLQKVKLENVSNPAPTPGVVHIPTPDYVPFESYQKILNQILELLKDDGNSARNIIGVCGTGGIGKTTLVKQLVKRAKANNDFDDVAIASVSRTPNIKEIQSSIAELIGLRIEEESLIGRATRLSQRLKQKSKVLVILDDLWEILKLEDVGIPYGSEHQGCKIVVTSRKCEMCNDMGAWRNFTMEKLSDLDAWKLFMSKAEDIVPKDLHGVAWKIVKGCEGNPNSVVTISRALRNKAIPAWNEAVWRLENPPELKIKGVQDKVVSALKFSYDQIETEEAKRCLLFCCMFPGYYNVSLDELVVYGLVDDLFPDASTLIEIRRRMVSIVEYLRSANFLLEGDREGCFKVHDDTRDVVTSVESKTGYKMMARAGLKFKSWPEEASRSFKRVSLMENDITKLPESPNCSEFLILLLQNNPIEEIPESFFLHMKALKYLDMSHTFISSLPRSLDQLQCLRSLRLENTYLRDATRLIVLKQLEVLILRGSSLEHLPDGLGEMSSLKLLDVSNNPYLRSFPANVLSKLSRLEELHVGSSFGDWELEGDANRVGFDEIASLPCLTVLHVHVKDTKVLSKNFNGNGPWGKLRKFRVCVHNDYWEIPFTRSMSLKNLFYPAADWVKVLLEKTENLSLTHARDFEDIVQKDVLGLNELKSLHLRACSVRCIFQSSLFSKVQKLERIHVQYCYSVKQVFYLEEIEADEQANLSTLRELILVGVPKMHNIWEGDISAARLENLQFIKVKECGKLSYLFPMVLVQKLHKLEHLAVMSCDNMVEIFPTKSTEIQREGARVTNSHITEPVVLFQNLQRLTVSKCKKMSSVLPLNVARGLKKLQELTVISCNMEEIFAENADEMVDQDLLAQLKVLALKDMSVLATFCKGVSRFKWPILQELQVWNCPKLKELPLGLDSAPKLRKFMGQLKWFETLKWEDEALKTRLQPLLVEEDW